MNADGAWNLCEHVLASFHAGEHTGEYNDRSTSLDPSSMRCTRLSIMHRKHDCNGRSSISTPKEDAQEPNVRADRFRTSCYNKCRRYDGAASLMCPGAVDGLLLQMAWLTGQDRSSGSFGRGKNPSHYYPFVLQFRRLRRRPISSVRLVIPSQLFPTWEQIFRHRGIRATTGFRAVWGTHDQKY